MRKPLTPVINGLAAVILLLGSCLLQAQQTPATTPQPSSPAKAKAPAAKAVQKPAAKSAAPLTLKTQKEKFSYAYGMRIGTGLHRQSVEINPSIFARGLRDGLAGGKTLLTEDEAEAALNQMQMDMRKMQSEKAQRAGTAFLEANKGKEGVVTLPSGMQYKILQAGTGPKPTAADTVVCNYRGTLIDGKEFDSSYKRGQPATFPVSGVIKGWTEALQLMPVGSKWQLFIPPQLAYGERGAGADIGPDATLVFEVELLSIGEKPVDKAGDKSEDKKDDKK